MGPVACYANSEASLMPHPLNIISIQYRRQG